MKADLSELGDSTNAFALGDCVDLIIDHRGKTPKKLGGDWTDDGVTVISAKNVKGGKIANEDSLRYVSYDMYKRWMREDVKRGDCFLVSEGATLGECMYWDHDFPIVLSQRIFCIRTNPEVLDPKYFYAYMNTNRFQSEIVGRSTGSSVPGLRQTELLKMEVRLLSIKRQKFIGGLLHKLDKKIELNRKQNRTLEAIAQVLFKRWFVEFEFPDENGQPYKSSGGAMQPSELGEIPVGWSITSLKAISEKISKGTTPTQSQVKSAADEPSIPFLKVKDINNFGDINRSSLEKISATIHKGALKRSILKDQDILFSIAGTIGRVSVVEKDLDDSNTNQAIAFIRLSEPDLHLGLCLQHLRSSRLQHDVEASIVQGVQANVSLATISGLKILIPGDEMLMTWSNVFNPIYDKQKRNSAEVRLLTSLRDTLLPKLMSGELRVA